MSKIRARGEEVRRFILENVEKQEDTALARLAAERFGITRQAVNKHLQRLTAEGALTESGKTRARSYKLAPLSTWGAAYDITPAIEEHRIWADDIKPHLGHLPDNVLDIWNIGFTEMFNNAKDHSEGKTVGVSIWKTALDCQMAIIDDGVGIFDKIQKALSLESPRHAVLELVKGKFTTDPRHHSGQGIFFTSRMFDSFAISSRGVFHSHAYGAREDWIMNMDGNRIDGTGVLLKLNNHTARTAKAVYDDFSSIEEGFFKTVVPVKLAQQGNDQLVSRSQAKRVVAGLNRFSVVNFDFRNVAEIGQAFADEIFRVFASQHPEIELRAIGANEGVARMIANARSGGEVAPQPGLFPDVGLQ